MVRDWLWAGCSVPGDGVVPCDGANSHRESVPLESCGPAPECPECVWWPSADGGQGGRGRVFCLFGEIRACASVEPRVSCVPEHRLCGAGQALSDFLSSFLVTSRLFSGGSQVGLVSGDQCGYGKHLSSYKPPLLRGCCVSAVLWLCSCY